MFRFLRTMSHKALKNETNIKKTGKVWSFHEKDVSLLRFNNIHSIYFQKRILEALPHYLSCFFVFALLFFL